MRILIAEDDPTSASLLEAVLRKFGYEVVAVSDGTRALELLLAPDAPRLAILDWMMPGLDGPEVCRRLREAAPSQPHYLLVLTTRGSKTDTVTAIEAGADDFLTKPYDLGELRARVQAGLRILRMQDALEQRVAELQRAVDRIRQLEGLLPICSYCKQIRDENGAWTRVDHYLEARTQAHFTHSICPSCLHERFGEDGEEPEPGRG